MEDLYETDASLVRSLIRVWNNEQNSPEIMNFEKDIVDDVLRSIKEQEGKIEHINESKKEEDRLNLQFLVNIYKMELERVCYVLRSYFRARLSKVHVINKSIA